MRSSLRTVVLGVFVVAVFLGSCSSADPTIRGVVIDVQGDLLDIERFTVLTPDGDRVELNPAPDVRFHDGAPLSHLNEHLRNGDPVEVTYRELDDGTKAAVGVEDVSGDS